MTKEQAIAAMMLGKKITHQYFGNEEWIRMAPDGRYETEDGYLINPALFWIDHKWEQWESGYSIFNEQSK